VDHHRQVGRALGGGHAEIPHFIRQSRQDLLHAVLHERLRAVDVCPDAEGDGQRQ
jgi:hypothetical protein